MWSGILEQLVMAASTFKQTTRRSCTFRGLSNIVCNIIQSKDGGVGVLCSHCAHTAENRIHTVCNEPDEDIELVLILTDTFY